MKFRNSLMVGAIAAGLMITSTSIADSDIATGNNASVSADLEFQVIIPEFIYFQVGDSGSNVNTITFDFNTGAAPTPSDIVDGTASNPGTGGDQSNGSVTVRLVSNSGAAEVTPTVSGTSGLSNGSDNINWARIETASDDDTGFPAPSLSNSGGSTVTVSPSSGQFVNRQSIWTYTFNASDTPSLGGAFGPAPGTYSGTVTYTAVSQ